MNEKWWKEKNPLVRAHLEGYHYGYMHLRPTLNPYPEGSEEEKEWDKGWKQGATFTVKQQDI